MTGTGLKKCRPSMVRHTSALDGIKTQRQPTDNTRCAPLACLIRGGAAFGYGGGCNLCNTNRRRIRSQDSTRRHLSRELAEDGLFQ